MEWMDTHAALCGSECLRIKEDAVEYIGQKKHNKKVY